MSEYDYSDNTYNSKNFLVRFSHRNRFKKALSCVMKEKKNDTLLDYGTGDGHFLIELSKEKKFIDLVGFEPIMLPKNNNEIKYYNSLTDIPNKKFDIVTCFEVLEHFNSLEEENILVNISNLLNENGKTIISVPIEIYLPSFIQNIIRLTYHKLNISYLKNTFKALFAIEIPEIRESNGYIGTHLGFNHKKFEKILSKYFIIEKKIYSPFKFLNSYFNSQVFYVAKKCESPDKSTQESS